LCFGCGEGRNEARFWTCKSCGEMRMEAEVSCWPDSFRMSLLPFILIWYPDLCLQSLALSLVATQHLHPFTRDFDGPRVPLLRSACDSWLAISPHTYYAHCKLFKLGGTTTGETKALTKSLPLVVNQLGFPEGNKFVMRCAAFYEVQPWYGPPTWRSLPRRVQSIVSANIFGLLVWGEEQTSQNRGVW